MKRAITLLALSGSLIIILSAFQFGHVVAMFLLAGFVPGTNLVVTPDQMFLIIALIAGFAIARLITPGLRRFVVKR